MTSSQALTINAVGPLVENYTWATRLLQSALPPVGVVSVERIDIEWAPRRRSEYLGDMTRIDVIFHVRACSGVRVIAAEVKYLDRFNSRVVNVKDNPRYHAVADRHHLWCDISATFTNPRHNQMLRVHALAQAHAEKLYGRTARSAVLVVAHPADVLSAQLVQEYQQQLRESQLCALIDWPAWSRHAQQTVSREHERRWVGVFDERYCREDYSEAHLDLRRCGRAASSPPSTVGV